MSRPDEPEHEHRRTQSLEQKQGRRRGGRALATRLRAAFGLGLAQVRQAPARSTLAVIGIAVAVLATTLLASTGFGVLETGQQKFDASGFDIWVTGGPVSLDPSGGGAFEGAIFDSHQVSENLTRHERVAGASPVALRAVYVGTSPGDLKLVTGVGATGIGAANFTGDDPHYADGHYSGPMTREVLIGPRTAALLNVSVGDAIYIGGSKATARQYQFEVVGVSSQYSQFVGTPTVVGHLSELQTVTGSAGTDRATFLTARVTDGADPETVRDDLARQFPEYEFRTNQEQLRQTLQQNALVIASSAVLVALAVVAGVALTANLLAIIVAQQHTELAVLRAIGLSKTVVVGSIGSQAVVLAVAGGTLGLVSTPLVAAGLNQVIVAVTGFESLLRTPPVVYLVGGGVALGIGTLSAVAVAWQATRLPPLVALRE